jgi:uncharacterized protein
MISEGEFVVTRLLPHQDLRLACMAVARDRQLTAAAVISCVGSLERLTIRFANRPEATVLEGKFEILTLSGMFAPDNAHLHITVGDTNGMVLGGHLLNESLIYTTAELAAVSFPSLEFQRQIDPTYGYKELIIHPKLTQ